MGREFQPPEQADSWGEFHARIEQEQAAAEASRPELWCAGALLFAIALVAGGYAFTDHHWWLWLAMLNPLVVAGVMAVRALERADRLRARAVELERLENAWLAHVASCSPTRQTSADAGDATGCRHHFSDAQ